MNCIVTAGPTYESLDKVRRLTNSSTGRLGIELANSLAARGHDAACRQPKRARTSSPLAARTAVGTQASYAGERRARRVETFTTTADLRERLQNLANQSTDAVFHPAAVSDFLFGKIWSRSPQGALSEIKSGKISTRQGTLLAELVPTPKIIAGLRDWFPKARIVGWKYETDGDRASVVRAAAKQISECLTDACVANGPGYGDGFGIVLGNGKCSHMPDSAALFEALLQVAEG